MASLLTPIKMWMAPQMSTFFRVSPKKVMRTRCRHSPREACNWPEMCRRILWRYPFCEILQRNKKLTLKQNGPYDFAHFDADQNSFGPYVFTDEMYWKAHGPNPFRSVPNVVKKCGPVWKKNEVKIKHRLQGWSLKDAHRRNYPHPPSLCMASVVSGGILSAWLFFGKPDAEKNTKSRKTWYKNSMHNIWQALRAWVHVLRPFMPQETTLAKILSHPAPKTSPSF